MIWHESRAGPFALGARPELKTRDLDLPRRSESEQRAARLSNLVEAPDQFDGSNNGNGNGSRTKASSVLDEPLDGEAVDFNQDDAIIDLSDDLDEDRLFDQDEAADEPTAAHDALTDIDSAVQAESNGSRRAAASPLGSAAASADDAMREFFDDEDEAAKGGFFRRR